MSIPSNRLSSTNTFTFFHLHMLIGEYQRLRGRYAALADKLRPRGRFVSLQVEEIADRLERHISLCTTRIGRLNARLRGEAA